MSKHSIVDNSSAVKKAKITPKEWIKSMAEPNSLKYATAGNRTRVNCLEGSYAHHYTTVAY